MNKKHGLGKGLGALIPEEELIEDRDIDKISINLIKANSQQPRKRFDEDKIYALTQSIKEHGVIQPILLKKEGETYVIVAGERRWRAAKAAGLKEIPAVVMELSNKEVLELSLIENIQREDLNPIEEALAYKRLLEEFDLTQEQLSLRIGKSRTAITNTMRLLNLDKAVQQYIIDGVISEGHGRTLLALENHKQQCIIAQTIIDEQLSVRETEKLIKSLSVEKKNKKKDTADNPYVVDIREKLQEYFGTKVNMNYRNHKGKIEIEYYSDEDLQRILELLDL